MAIVSRSMTRITLLVAAVALAGIVLFASTAHAEPCPANWSEDPSGYPAYKRDCVGPGSDKHIFGNSLANVIGDRSGAATLFVSNRGAAEFGGRVGLGYSIVSYPGSDEPFVTGGAARSAGATSSQRFGINYLETATSDDKLEIVHKLEAPPDARGDDPAVTDTVTLTNVSNSDVVFTHHELWDASYRALSSPVTWARPSTGIFAGLTTFQDFLRNLFSMLFWTRTEHAAEADTSQRLPMGESLTVKRKWMGIGKHATQPDAITTNNFYVQDLVLATDTSGVTLSTRLPVDVARVVGSAWNQPVIAGTSVHGLAPGESVNLVFESRLNRNSDAPAPPAATAPRISAPLDPPMHGCEDALGTKHCAALAREYRWKTGQVQGWALLRDFYGKYATPQGSLYLYKQGWDGAPRDLDQIVPAMTRVNPELARQILEMMMAVQVSNPRVADWGPGNRSYGFYGYGCAGLVTQPCKGPLAAAPFGVRSDLDQSLLWAFNEYARSLDEAEFATWLTGADIAFYPPGSIPPTVAGTTPLDHVRAAFYHLRDTVGVGKHGLVRLRDGDWNDSVITIFLYNGHLLSPNIQRVAAESIPSSAMALSVLPDTAEIVRPYDPSLADEMLAFATELVPGLRGAFDHDPASPWFGRAWMKDIFGRWILIESDHINVYAQVWALQNNNFVEFGVLSESEQINLLELIHERVDSTSRIGTPTVSRFAHLGFPANSPYAQGSLRSWSSMRSLLAIAYGRFATTRRLAWQELWNSSFANYAELFPSSWAGVLSGPDGWTLNPPPPSWNYGLLSMNEFPYANSNPSSDWAHALWEVGASN